MARLPPLYALHAFVAGAKHGSFKKAAEELSVTPSAITRQIQQLEEFFDVYLFDREYKSVKLTLKGAHYFNQVKEFFDHLQHASDTLLSINRKPTINIDCGASFAMHWLLEKLSLFYGTTPHADITVRNYQGMVYNDFDFAIRLNTEDFADHPYVELFPEYCVPVCSPTLANLETLQTPADLKRFKTLHIHKRPDLWPLWIKCANERIEILKNKTYVELTFLAIQAAESGMGIAMVPLLYVEQHIKNGRLVVPFNTAPVKSGTYYLGHAPYREKAYTKAFYQWITHVAAQFSHANYGLK